MVALVVSSRSSHQLTDEIPACRYMISILYQNGANTVGTNASLHDHYHSVLYVFFIQSKEREAVWQRFRIVHRAGCFQILVSNKILLIISGARKKK